MSKETITLLEIDNSCSIIANSDNIVFTNYKLLTNLNENAQMLFKDLEILIGKEIAEEKDDHLIISSEDLYELYNSDYCFSDFLPDLSPYFIRIESTSSMGRDDFKFKPIFYSCSKEIYPTRVGNFIKRGSTLYCLLNNQAKVLNTIDEFNSSPNDKKSKINALLALNQISEVIDQNSINLDDYLKENKVIVPKKIKLNIEPSTVDENLVSVIPEILQGNNQKAFVDSYFANEAKQIYDIGSEDLERIRIVLNDDLFRIVKKIRNDFIHIGGNQKDQLLMNPREVIDDETFDLIDIDELIEFNFSDRVKGIGNYVFQAAPFIKRKSNEWFDFNKGDEAGFIYEDIRGNTKSLIFKDQDSITQFDDNLFACEAKGLETFEFKGKTFKYSEPLKEKFDEIKNAIKEKAAKVDLKDRETENRYLLIYENEDILEFSISTEDDDKATTLHYEQPTALKKEVSEKKFQGLLEYQEQGVACLQSLFKRRSSRKGVLLADDMGLGKTLQVLTFLAWCIETGYPKLKEQLESPFLEPILIITPITLLENWRQEIETFFDGCGSIFSPFEIIDSSNIKKFRKEVGSREYKVGKEVLRIKPDENDFNKEYLLKYKVLITNYDTVKNYQHSFGKVNWSIVVADEAQWIKNQKTSYSFALKSLKSIFKIAMSGTPVENRLLELWNLIDFFQPGLLLKSSKEFTNEFEVKNFSDFDDIVQKTNRLRERLRYGKHLPYVLRRDKETYLSSKLPKKIIDNPAGIHYCELSNIERDKYLDILEEKKRGEQHALVTIQKLKMLSMHITLLTEDSSDRDPSYYLQKSSKLQKLIQILHTIKKKKEKVLIFSRTILMQKILIKVIEHEFGIKLFPPINGQCKARTKYGNTDRKSIVDRFQQEDGFGVLILSPEVAGVGLNIVKANHVIHYERWWNPAKENQANDRAYRLGQEKDVYIYHLIYKDSLGEFLTFDEKLHQLLEGKKNLASNFLIPCESLEITERQFLDLDSNHFSQSSKEFVESIKSIEDIRNLGPKFFEPFVACLYEKLGYEVILTPETNDRGVDVIAYDENEIVLVQCKHKRTISPYYKDSVVDEIENGKVHYQMNILDREAIDSREIKATLVTNSEISLELQKRLQLANIAQCDKNVLRDYIKKFKITTKDIEKVESMRVNKVEQISNLMKKVSI